MTLPNVVEHQPHVVAHNDERAVINTLLSLVESGRLSVDGLAKNFPTADVVDFAGKKARWYGDSWSAGYGLPAGDSYIQKAAEAVGITTFENLGISGSALQSIGGIMLWGGQAYEWSPGDADLLVINAGINDARYNDLSLAANYKWLKSMKHSLRIAVTLALGSARVVWNNYSRWTYSGAWFGGPYVYSTNGTDIAATQTPGASATFSFEGPEVTAYIGSYITESKCVADIFIDDELRRTVRFVDDAVTYPGSGANVGFRAERFTGLGPGPHTIKFMKSDSTSHALYIDSALAPSSTPPVVVLAKEPTLPADVYAMYDPYNNGNDNSIKAMQKVVDDVASEFPGVRLCTLPVLTPVTDFQADLIHPDTSGRDKLRDALVETLEANRLTDLIEDRAVSARISRAIGFPRRSVVSRFRAPQTLAPYKIPEGAVALGIRLAGGAGGGASGRRGAAGTVRCGGGGGAGGAADEIWLSTYGLPSTIYVTAGPGGVGGAAVATNDTNGNPGSNGTPSYVVTDSALPADESIYLAFAGGGAGGMGGTAAAGVGGAAAASRQGLTSPGGSANGTGGAGASTTGNGYNGVGQGGGAGGGINASNTAANGGAGWWSGMFLIGIIPAPSAGVAPGGDGTSGTATTLQGRLATGPSGGGGAAHASGVGGNGGAGGYGSGGGGGGASVNGNASGAGGAGGDGWVEIIALF